MTRGLSEVIAERLALGPVPGLPEIRLHTAGPASGLRRLAERAGGDEGAPYWAHLWGGGLALARYVLDRPETVAGRSVFDLGAGSGIVGIAAALAGAKPVLAADTDRWAIAATRLNAEANGVAVSTLPGDVTAGPPPAVDIVLVGDLFYEAGLARRVTVFLDRCLDAGLAVLIGDPGRAFLPRARLVLLAEYPGPDFGTGAAWGRNAVFSFTPG